MRDIRETRPIRTDIRPERTELRDKEKDIKNDDKIPREIKELIRGFVGKNIIVQIRGKKSLRGRLESVTQYELFITSPAHEPILIMKHAIDYIELTEMTS